MDDVSGGQEVGRRLSGPVIWSGCVGKLSQTFAALAIVLNGEPHNAIAGPFKRAARNLSGLGQGHLPIDRTMVLRRLIRPFSCAQTILSCATL